MCRCPCVAGRPGGERQRGRPGRAPLKGAQRPRVQRDGPDLEAADVPHRGRAARREGWRRAEKVRTRLLRQVDQKRNPRTRATVDQLLDKWLQVLDVDPSTRRPVDPSTRQSYEGYIRKHIRSVLGSLPLSRLDVETLDSFYAELRRCREHCDGRPHFQHRTS